MIGPMFRQREKIWQRHAVLLDRTRRNADSRGIFLERAEQNRICRYGTVITDLERTENLCAGTDRHIISQRRMTFTLLCSDTAQRHTLVNRTVVADHRRLTDDNAAAVVNQNTVSELCTRMNLNQCKETCHL